MDKKHLWCIRYVSVWKAGGILETLWVLFVMELGQVISNQ